MTPTPPVPEIEELTQRLIDEGCQGEDEQGCTRDDALIPRDQWCVNCLAGVALSALTTERLARQQAERERDAAMMDKATWLNAAGELRAQLTLSEQARAQAEQDLKVYKQAAETEGANFRVAKELHAESEQARARLRTALEDAVESMEIAENAYPNVLGHSLKIARAALTVPQETTTDETP